MPKRERLQEFYRRLGAAPAADSFEQAREQHAAILNGVEDEYIGSPFNPSGWAHDQRMYPPQDDSMTEVANDPPVWRFRSFAHYTYIGANGAIEMYAKDGTLEFRKNGADGRGVWD